MKKHYTDVKNILITIHARKRVMERFGCKESKVDKIAKKAWISKVKVPARYISKFNQQIARGEHIKNLKNKVYRFYQEYLFIFYVGIDDMDLKQKPFLITIFKTVCANKKFYRKNCYKVGIEKLAS